MHRQRFEDRFTVTCKKCGYQEIHPGKANAQKWLKTCPQCAVNVATKGDK